MTVKELVEALPLKVTAGQTELGRQVTGGYVSDLLSNVMGFATAGSIWITMQGHQNVVAVAALANLAAVILAGGAQPDAETVEKAEREGVVLLTTSLPAFELAGKLHAMGINGV